MFKYLPWGLVILLGIALVWSLLMPSTGTAVGIVDLGRVVDESPLAQELNRMLSDRYNELIIQFNLEEDETGADEEAEIDRQERERRAYAQYLAYREELETELQQEVDQAIKKVAQDKSLKVVFDFDVVRFGGVDLTDAITERLK